MVYLRKNGTTDDDDDDAGGGGGGGGDDDDVNVAIGKRVFNAVRASTGVLDGIADCVRKFADTVDAFMEIVDKSAELQMNGEISAAYMRDLTDCVDAVRDLYGVPKRRPVRIDVSKLNLNVWGNAYWDVLHCASVLIQEAYYRKRVNTLLNFPALVYNIDNILPCPVCLGHYLQIKNGRENASVLQAMSFGLLVYGMFSFHSLINKNIRKPGEFTDLDFAIKYKCFARSSADRAINYGIIPCRVLFHSERHVRLAVLLNIVYRVDLFRASNDLERAYAEKPLGPEDLERERESFGATITEQIDVNDRETARVVGFCHRNAYPPPELNVWSFESLDNFRHVAEYWIAAIDCKPQHTYTVLFKNKQTVTIQNNTLSSPLLPPPSTTTTTTTTTDNP
ncbi:hypothetical protein AGLY_017554 [Aphis glycines]|uniref:Sulfhydryl oxidase n=1 Tax=Aphis glycines TaxID=307491 RepID=A0A6G0SVP9_APHGL|nr:hypothetical protein AGLY_017554 [Aphis glycines]